MPGEFRTDARWVRDASTSDAASVHIAPRPSTDARNGPGGPATVGMVPACHCHPASTARTGAAT